MESGLTAAAAQLENRQRRFGLRLLSLPQGDQAREIVGAPTATGRRLVNALAYAGKMERTVLLEEPETLMRSCCRRRRRRKSKLRQRRIDWDSPYLRTGHDLMVVRRDTRWYGRGARTGWAPKPTCMGYIQEAYDAECAALARALESASRRPTSPERITIFTDAQAAIRRMASAEPGPGQQYVLQARKHIATLRRARPGVIIEIRWCPTHRGVTGNEKAEEWAKLAAEEPGARGVGWLSYLDRAEARAIPLSRSLAHLKREISKKWAEVRQ